MSPLVDVSLLPGVASLAQKCAPLDLACKGKESIAVVMSGAMGDFVKSMADGVLSTLKVLNSMWMAIPSPDVRSDTVLAMQANIEWYTLGFATLGLLIGIMRVITTQQVRAGESAVRMIFNLILVTGAYGFGATLLLRAGDIFAPWIVESVNRGETLNFSDAISKDALLSLGLGPALLLVIVAFFGAIANVIFMLVRTVMIGVLFVFLPALAASSASETGMQAFKKANGYLIAFLLFKPVAAVILALGLNLLYNPPSFSGMDSLGKALIQVSTGVLTLVAAGIALPALIKFVAPIAANGTSMMFSGGAVAAAGVAAGAAVATVAVSGGAAAVAGGSSAAGTAGTAGTAGSGGATGAGGAAGAEGAAGAGGPTGPVGSGSSPGMGSAAGGTDAGTATPPASAASASSSSGSSAPATSSTMPGSQTASSNHGASVPSTSGATSASQMPSPPPDTRRASIRAAADAAAQAITAQGSVADDVSKER